MILARKLKMSPLSPYTESMLDKTIILDTKKAKKELNWRPTLNNSEMLLKSYQYFVAHRTQIATGSTNKDLPKPGLIKLLKWIS
jgi:nucleoside-diphosphate-sugar epimerase